MLAPHSCATLDRVLVTMFWRPARAGEAPIQPSEASEASEPDALLAQLASEESAEEIAIWLQEERALPAAAAEHIADRCAAARRR